jgi:26S proteasome non-ATPase regulatory subunit 10
VEKVRALLQGGASVNAADGGGAAALHLAASKGRVEVARVLLERGASVDAVSAQGNTALHGLLQFRSR